MPPRRNHPPSLARKREILLNRKARAEISLAEIYRDMGEDLKAKAIETAMATPENTPGYPAKVNQVNSNNGNGKEPVPTVYECGSFWGADHT